MVLCLEVVFAYIIQVTPGLHKLCNPTIRDGSTWSKFGARGEHGDVFLSSQVKNSLFSFRHFLVTVLKKINIRTCEHMILGQLTMGARQTKNAPLGDTYNDRWPLECSNMLGAVQKANVLL